MVRKEITVAALHWKGQQTEVMYGTQRKHGALKFCFSVSCNWAEGYWAVWPFCHISVHPRGTSHPLKDRYAVVIFKFLITLSTYKHKSFCLFSFIKPSPPSRVSQSTNCAISTASTYLMITDYVHPLPEINDFWKYPFVIRAGFSEQVKAKSTGKATHNFMMPMKSVIKSNALCIPKGCSISTDTSDKSI